MQCIIRLDDITADMNWDRFNTVKNLLDSYGVKPLIGVVPQCKDESLHIDDSRVDFWEYIKGLQLSGWTIAQHGTYHIYETTNSGLLGINPFSEFAGMSYDAQHTKLKSGQDILKAHGIFTDIFMAPGHTYDTNTVRALRDLGFRAITDGLYKKPYTMNGILFVPCRLKSGYNISGFDTICLHTNTITDTMIEDLRRFLDAHSSEVIPFDIDKLMPEAVPFSDNIKKYEFKAVNRRNRKKGLSSNPKIEWYLKYTNHKNSKVKLIKRIIFLPLLLIKKPEE